MARGSQLMCAISVLGVLSACGTEVPSYTAALVDVSEAQGASHYSLLITVEGPEVQDMPGIGSDRVVVRTDLESVRCRDNENPEDVDDLRRGGNVSFRWDGSTAEASAPPQIDANGSVTVDC